MSDEADHEPAEEIVAPSPSIAPEAAPFNASVAHAAYGEPAFAAAAHAPNQAEETWTFAPRHRPDPPKLRTWEALWLGLATGVSLLAAPVGFVAAILSPMVFDPHQNLWNPAAWIAFFLIISFWMVCIAAPYGAWVAFLRRMRILTWLAMAAPLVWVVAAVASVNFLPG